MMYCTDCFQYGSLDEVGWDIWEGGEEYQYQCTCSNDIRSKVILYDECEIKYYGIYERQDNE